MQFFAYLRAELNSQWSVIKSARIKKQYDSTRKTKKETRETEKRKTNESVEAFSTNKIS